MDDITQSSTLINTAHDYARRGWSVLPLHHITPPGQCSCQAGPECPEGARGKHPRWKLWTRRDAMSGADIETHWTDFLRDNIGVRTGTPSGFFAVDIDPKNGGQESWGKLLSAHGGELPITRGVLTGSGGTHLYFQMPDFHVSNSAKRMPPGIDIRGTGGLVVMPPSISGIGDYQWLNECDIAPAPGWLLDLVRPAPGSADVTDAAQEDLPAFGDLEASEQDRLSGYATRTLRLIAGEYVQTAQGHGDTALFAASCSALELAQSPWNLLTVGDVHGELDGARRLRLDMAGDWGGGQTPADFERIWRQARSRTAGRGRPVPTDPHAGVQFENPSRPVGRESVSGGETDRSDKTDKSGEVRSGETGKPKTRTERIRSLLYPRSALDDIPPPTPLIEGALDVATLAVLAGKFGTYKSMVSIAWACSLATGKPWFGRKVPEAKPVLYVAAEGLSGISRRVRAWESAHLDDFERVPDHMLQVIGGGLRITEAEDLATLDAIIAEMGAGLLVLDTLHRCAPGIEEQSNTDMGRVIEAVSMLRERNNVTVVMDHHTGHAGQRARGASAIEDDIDTSWVIRLADNDGDDRGPDNLRTMIHRKTKDGELSGEIPLKLEVVGKGAYVDQAERRILDLSNTPKWLIPRELAKALDALGAPPAMGRPRAISLLRGKGYAFSSEQITEAIKVRKTGEHLISTPSLAPYDESDITESD